MTLPGHSIMCLTQCGVGAVPGAPGRTWPSPSSVLPFWEERVNVVQSRIWPAFAQPWTAAAEGGTSPCSLVSSELTGGGTGEFVSSVTMTFHGFFPCILIRCLAGITPVSNLIKVALLRAQGSSERVRNAPKSSL